MSNLHNLQGLIIEIIISRDLNKVSLIDRF